MHQPPQPVRLASGSEILSRECGGIDSVRKAFNAFANAVEGKAANIVPHDEIIHVVEVLEAAARSMLTGQALDL